MLCKTLRRISISAFICMVLLCFVVQTNAARVPFSTPFTYFADNQDLATVLTQFARNQGYTASLSPSVSGKVSGRFENIEPKLFLDSMQSAFNVSWYTLGKTLYFYNISEMERTFITPHTVSASRLVQSLKNSDFIAPQLPLEIGRDNKVLIISGPKIYLSQIANAAIAFDEAQAGQSVMKVFPLKYAWADDISVTSMDKTVTIPGIATILRAMITGQPLAGTQVTQEKANVDKLGGKGLISQGSQKEKPEQGKEQKPQIVSNVMADTRVNAVIINDAPYKMPYYEKVIADLDKPVELVEIHAAIVDIDSNFTRNLGVTYQGSYNKDRGWGGGGSYRNKTEVTGQELQANSLIKNTGLALSTIYTHGTDFFLSRISALEEKGEARMLGRPSVLTVDNVQATLENTTTYYVPVEGKEVADLFKVEAGTVLRVTPHIIKENGITSIKLAVNVQDDQNSSNTATDGSALPPIKQTKINTQAIIGEGQSLLVGGYSYETKKTDSSGVPILMHIPWIGNLFKNTDKEAKRMERLILLTPRVIKLNELPQVPSRVQEPTFVLSPTMPTYEPQTKHEPQKASGCSAYRQNHTEYTRP